MSSHFGSVEFNFPTGSTMTGSQCFPAAGYAEGLEAGAQAGQAVSARRQSSATTTASSTPRSATARRLKAKSKRRSATRCATWPRCMFVVEDDEWAISTPVEREHPRRQRREAVPPLLAHRAATTTSK